MILRFSLLVSLLLLLQCAGTNRTPEPIRVLILSGRNNHNWEETTSVLKSDFQKSGRFIAEVTNRPDTLTYMHLSKYDALLSNWNSWPENDLRWPKAAEEGITRFLEEGGGLVFFHSSSSAFYRWDRFREFTTASWEEQTWHGKPCEVLVTFQNTGHPIVMDMPSFVLSDELWIDARQNERFTTLGMAEVHNPQESSPPPQPAVFTGQFGKGRVFHTILGHDATTLRNPGLTTLLLRGTEWAATGKVTLPVSEELHP